jgi:hypothetical protein
MTPQARTRDYLTKRGYLCGTVESRKSFPDKKKSPCSACGHAPLISVSQDLWNVFDLVAVYPTKVSSVLFVQTTSRANHATRRNKILSSMESKLVLQSGALILLQSWGQDVDGHWTPKDEYITLRDFKSALHYPNDVAALAEIRRKAKRPDLPVGSSLKGLVGNEPDLPPQRKVRYMPITDEQIPF